MSAQNWPIHQPRNEVPTHTLTPHLALTALHPLAKLPHLAPPLPCTAPSLPSTAPSLPLGVAGRLYAWSQFLPLSLTDCALALATPSFVTNSRSDSKCTKYSTLGAFQIGFWPHPTCHSLPFFHALFFGSDFGVGIIIFWIWREMCRVRVGKCLKTKCCVRKYFFSQLLFYIHLVLNYFVIGEFFSLPVWCVHLFIDFFPEQCQENSVFLFEDHFWSFVMIRLLDQLSGVFKIIMTFSVQGCTKSKAANVWFLL